MTTDLALHSSSVDRRTRRYKVAFREAERLQRREGGEKPFYITLTGEGIPYGPGKASWTTKVNKLATRLDPSCTHIRKQTHESMCILKERLDYHFDYSGKLNEDHLRQMLGKAVTRKRTELIGMIKNGKDRPVTVDIEIWKRLENLVKSRQRENRSEIGRYANACLRTMGRTGALGEAGVREKLAEMYGRSPDPDEVAEEMERDKGYGKKDLKRLTVQEEYEDGGNDDVVQEFPTQKQSKGKRVEGNMKLPGHKNLRTHLQSAAFQVPT